MQDQITTQFLTHHSDTFLKSILTNTLTAMLNVRSWDSLSLLKNLDDRVNDGKTIPEKDCSFQVCNAYYSYLEWLHILDVEQFKKHHRL